MKKFRYILALLVIIILTSCGNSKPEDLSELILPPEISSPVLEGTWQVTTVEKGSDIPSSITPEVGDKLYINKNLVAINSEYAFPPQFTSKYVNLYEYLTNRGFNFNNIDMEESVVVVNASQGQFFARDFIKRSEDEIFYIADDNLVYLSRLSHNVDPAVVDEYTKLATSERVIEDDGEELVEDIALLIGVRERIDKASGQQDYNYYSYLIRIPADEKVKMQKANDIFLRGQDEYWKVRSRKNKYAGIYDKIEAFPVRLEEQMDEQNYIDRYTFKDFDMNIRLNFVDINYLSFSYTRQLFNNTISKYAVIETSALEENRLLSIDEFTGDNNAGEQFKNIVINEAVNKVPDIETEDIKIDYTNFGLVRDIGSWVGQTSIYTEESQQRLSSQIPVGNYLETKATNTGNITRDQVRNINAQVKDFHVLNNANYIVIQTADEILLHRIRDGFIEKSPFYSIATPYPTAFISIDQQSGTNAETLSDAFKNFNIIIESK